MEEFKLFSIAFCESTLNIIQYKGYEMLNLIFIKFNKLNNHDK